MAQNIIKLNLNKYNPDIMTDEEKLEVVSGIVKNIMKTCSGDKYEIYPLKLDYINVVQHHIAKVKLDEDMLIPVACYNNPFVLADNFVKINGISVARNLFMQVADKEKFDSIYSKATSIINSLTETMKKLPSDLDRIIYANEYLVENTTYSKTSYGSSRGGCLLALKQGMCSGFADALNILLHFSGVNSFEVSAAKMNHAWNYVEVDGELYHVDACWNNTKSKTDKLQHRYLLLSDTAIQKVRPTHYSFAVYANDKAYGNEKIENIKAPSTRFDNWWVHGVKGKMYYHDGLWYYLDDKTNEIKANNALGTKEKTILKLEDNIKSFDIEEGYLRIKL